MGGEEEKGEEWMESCSFLFTRVAFLQFYFSYFLIFFFFFLPRPKRNKARRHFYYRLRNPNWNPIPIDYFFFFFFKVHSSALTAIKNPYVFPLLAFYLFFFFFLSPFFSFPFDTSNNIARIIVIFRRHKLRVPV